MTNRRMLTLILVANLVTVALITGAFQAASLLAEGPVGSIEATDYDPNLQPTVPSEMNYQGILKDTGGNPLSGQHDLTFTIYYWNSFISKYEAVWAETHTGVQVTNGLFNVILGSQGTPLTGEVFAGVGGNTQDEGDTRLGVAVDGGAELSPRVPLLTVPYAHRAEYVNRFPEPDWQSSWYTIAQAETKTWTHNLGGNTDDYVVDLQFKNAADGINQVSYGGGYDDEGGSYGANWHDLTDSQIQVSRSSQDWAAEQVRVRIWRIK